MSWKHIRGTVSFKVDWLGKNTIKMKIKERKEYMWYSRTLQPQFERFKRIHSDFHMHFVWFISKLKPKLLPAAKSICVCVFVTLLTGGNKEIYPSIYLLQTPHPLGCNDTIYHEGNI